MTKSSKWAHSGGTMNRLRIIPLDDAVVFPGMPVTLTVDVGDDERVLLVPRRENVYATVGVVAEVSERVRMAGRGFAVTLMGAHRATLGGASADQGRRAARRLRGEAGREPAGHPDPRPGARVPRRRRRDSGTARRRRADPRVCAIDHRRRRAGRHGGVLAGPQLQSEAASPRDVRRRRAAQVVAAVSARPAGRAAGSQTYSRGRRGRRAEAAA